MAKAPIVGVSWTVVALAVTVAASSESAARSPKLPPAAPIPSPAPETQTPDGVAKSGVPPIPEPRPETAKPPPRDQVPQPEVPPPIPPAPRPTVSPEQMTACLDDLQKLGVEFSKEIPIADPSGCAIPNPVTLKNLGKTIKLAPGALLDCPMALAAARFMRDVAAPEAKADLGSDLVSINHASAYVCRPRHNGAKLSEHAFGNALDIAGFGLADGRQVDVKAEAAGREAKFLDAIRKAACGPFKTVLGPGSDADHALHFHFDLAPRRNGSTFCQ